MAKANFRVRSDEFTVYFDVQVGEGQGACHYCGQPGGSKMILVAQGVELRGAPCAQGSREFNIATSALGARLFLDRFVHTNPDGDDPNCRKKWQDDIFGRQSRPVIVKWAEVI